MSIKHQADSTISNPAIIATYNNTLSILLVTLQNRGVGYGPEVRSADSVANTIESDPATPFASWAGPQLPHL